MDIITEFNGPHFKLILTYLRDFELFFLHLIKTEKAKQSFFFFFMLQKVHSWVIQTHVYHCSTGPSGQIEAATCTGTFTPHPYRITTRS